MYTVFNTSRTLLRIHLLVFRKLKHRDEIQGLIRVTMYSMRILTKILSQKFGSLYISMIKSRLY